MHLFFINHLNCFLYMIQSFVDSEQDANSLLSENRLVYPDKQTLETFTCGICMEIISERSNPRECNQCHNQLYCYKCIEHWSKYKLSCPSCKSNRAKFIRINPMLMELLRSMRYKCKYSKEGCKEQC